MKESNVRQIINNFKDNTAVGFNSISVMILKLVVESISNLTKEVIDVIENDKELENIMSVESTVISNEKQVDIDAEKTYNVEQIATKMKMLFNCVKMLLNFYKIKLNEC